MSAPQQMFPDSFFNMVWRPFTNSEAAVIPAFSVMEQADHNSPISADNLIIQVRKPVHSVCGPMTPFWVNSQLQAAASAIGSPPQGFCSALMNNAGLVAYDTGSGTPTAGQVWGPKTGSWLLTKDYPGFLITSEPAIVNGIHVVPAMQQVVPVQCYLQQDFAGKTAAAGSYLVPAGVTDVSLVPGPYVDGTGLKVNLVGRYEYDFYGTVTNDTYTVVSATFKTATVAVKAAKVDSGGGITDLYSTASATVMQISGVTIPGVVRLRGFVNMNHNDTVKIRVDSISPSGTASFSEGVLTVKYIGPQLTANNAMAQ